MRVVAVALAVSALCAGSAAASTGVCDSNPPTTTDACIAAVESGGTVVNDIFHDANGRTGPELPVFGQLFNQWPGCDATTFAGCAGQSQPPFDCPGEYVCNPDPNTFANAARYTQGLDRLWWHPCRLASHDVDQNGCPVLTCIGDGVGGSYFPWEGLVFDLGGQSNKVAIFAENDHGPQPCESTEYTVFLSNNPMARDLVANPAADGVDPNKWNRAVLSSIYTKGFVEVRAPDPAGHASCGDTADYSVEEDSFVTVYSLPCGVTFRYAAVVAGNDGLDFPACAYDSQEAELDAVAGLSEDGAAVCPDADGDLYPDCNCPGAPSVCDCNDADPSVHPGASEACDATADQNCDGVTGGCAAGLTCHDGACLGACTVGEVSFCPGGATCESTPDGLLCVPRDCTQTGCPQGAVCSSGRCVPDCTGVSCPSGQVCRDGSCIDLCASVACPGGQVCVDGACKPPCTCLAGDLGCADVQGAVCGADGSCVDPACASVTCGAGQHCDPATAACVGQCDGVTCPLGQECVEGSGCVSSCDSITCDAGLTCDPTTGACVEPDCVGVVCGNGQVCLGGVCTAPGDAGPVVDGGNAGGDDAGPGDGVDAGVGGTGGGAAVQSCGCTSGAPSDVAGAAALLALVALLGRRRATSV